DLAARQSIVAYDLRTVICIPLRKRAAGADYHENDFLGVLYLDSRLQPGKLSQVDNDLLDVFAVKSF
ncbi:MAG: serine/threonine protein phosphatase, partial [Verrucomicrobiota bacterium]